MNGEAPYGRPVHWGTIVRLGLVQAALGAVVVLVTSTLNRVMVVEYALPTVLPGALVALHYAVQLIRPRFGYASDAGVRRTPWIVGGMCVLAVGGLLCALAAVWISGNLWWGLTLAALAYAVVGLGVGAAGTSLLVLMAQLVDARRRAAAATIMWILMIAGFAVTSIAVGHFLDPFSPRRLLIASGAVVAVALLVAVLSIAGIEGDRLAIMPDQSRDRGRTRASGQTARRDLAFGAALRQVWSEPPARNFTVFVFVSMLAYSAQELLLEPFAGLVFGYSVGESAKLSGLWHSSALIGMVGVGIACSTSRRLGSLRGWTIAGCVESALALLSLAVVDLEKLAVLRLAVVVLGMANGSFAVAAIGSMMERAYAGNAERAGVRMGLWGAAQAIAFAVGGFLGTSIVGSSRYLFGSSDIAYAIVFGIEAILFLLAASFVTEANRAAQSASPGSLPAVSL